MSHRMEMWRTLRRVATITAVIAGGYFLVVRPVERSLSSARSDVKLGLDKVLGAVTGSDTRIVEGRAEIVETREIAELSLLEMRMSATRSYERTDHLMSLLSLGTKKMIVRGTYQVRAGYRLTPGVSLRVERGQPVARFPKARVLSVELVDFEVLNEEDGWMNRVQSADRSQILRELRQQMRLEASRSGMLETVDATLRTRLRDLIGAETVTVVEELP